MREFLRKSGILVWVIAAITLMTVLGSVRIGDDHLVPVETGRTFTTFSTISSQFLPFSIPLIITGLVIPATADPGRSAGKWLGTTTATAYASTLLPGFLTHLMYASLFPHLLASIRLADVTEPGSALGFYLTIETPAPLQVMTALLLPFVVGLDLLMVPRGVLRKGFIEFRAIITRLTEMTIIPLLLLHTLDIFLNLAHTDEATSVIQTLVRVVIVALVLEVIILLTQFCFAGFITCRSPFEALLAVMSTYPTAPGTSPFAATILMTLCQTKKNGVSGAVVSFMILLCVTTRPANSTSKILSFALAIVLTQGLMVGSLQWVGFILVLGIAMVAAPGVPGGAIMAATDLLNSMLGFNDAQVALMITTYIALDSFGIATNVTDDGAIVLVVDRMAHGPIGTEGDPENARELAFDGMACPDRVPIEGAVSPEEPAESFARNSSETVV